VSGVCRTALLDGGPKDGRQVAISEAAGLAAPEVVVEHDGITHRYVAAVGPSADRWRRSGVALYSWQKP